MDDDDNGKPSMRIDWFDGTIIENLKPSPSASQFAEDEEETPKFESKQKRPPTENKPIGFKRLHEISLMSGPIAALEIANRPGFWNLFKQKELKDDFIVLIVKVLANVFKTTQPGDTMKLSKLLESELNNTNFLEKLIFYLRSLPNVKIAMKRMNAQLWDDVEGFYFNVLDMCEGISRTIIHRKGKIPLEKVNLSLAPLCEALQESVVGVREEHSERFSDGLYKRLEKLEALMQVKNVDNSECIVAGPPSPTETVMNGPPSGCISKDPTNYRNLSIFPTLHDIIPYNILSNTKNTINGTGANKSIKIKPNIVNGAYPDVENYIDVQFKLLREDYLGPLRKGICEYLKNPLKRRHENIRVYPEVRVLRTYISNNKVGHLIDIAWEERSRNLSIKNRQHLKLLFGSLLLFTNDKFQTILCATVLDCSIELLREGFIAVSFQNPVSKNIMSEPYLMVESEVFFEPYHQVLKVLKESQHYNAVHRLPMESYIVNVKPETKPPAYLTFETTYTIEAPDKSEIPFQVLDTDDWPTEQLGLDYSQLEAYKFALTREFAVIQGPPGTGKTFIGIKIASTILKNLSLEGTPMLVICYTNHALDQFLEGILNFTDSVIRLGSQSKSKKLESYNLNSVRAKMKCKYSYLYAKKRKELEDIYKEMTELHRNIEICDEGILCYKHIKQYLKVDGKEYELKSSDQDRTLNWLFEEIDDIGTSETDMLEINIPNKDNLEESKVNDCKIETCFTEKWALNEINSLHKMMDQVHIYKEVFNNPAVKEMMVRKIENIKRRLQYFKKMVIYRQGSVCRLPKVDNLYMLTADQRWMLYFNAARDVKNDLLTAMDALLEQHNKANIELDDISTMIDVEVIRTARVVGVTTTAAARRHRLIVNTKSPIVIVEEAAEVLEAHIIASLTSECQHLILIGDHKQLRPTAANYKLAREYNFEISLFERMIKNGIHARTLTIQRRMRADFSRLLVPDIYERLDNHDSVLNYPHVKGLKKDLFFFDHQVLEDTEDMEDSWSHKNTYEAEWCIALAKYLRDVEYRPQDITVLATYNGQVTLIKKLSEKYASLRDVKITAVDNFQGEESKIVILSLVRSNRDGRIGFLSAANRICVALSRAKEGFYIFGNMTILKSASAIWRSICEKLIGQNAIGDRMSLTIHDYEGTLDVKTAQELQEANFRSRRRLLNQ